MKRLLKFLRCALLSFVGAALMLLVPATGAAEVDAGSALPSYEELPAQAPDEALLKPLAAKSLKGRFEERRTLPGFPKPMVTTGVFELTGKTLRWEAEKPFPAIMIAGPDGVVMEAAGERQVLSAADIPAVGRCRSSFPGFSPGISQRSRKRSISELKSLRMEVFESPRARSPLSLLKSWER